MNTSYMNDALKDVLPRTVGARRAQKGEYVFDLLAVNRVMGGPGHPQAFGGCVEGARTLIAVLRAPAGQMGDSRRYPDEQWIYILEGEYDFRTEGRTFLVGVGGLIYIPAAQIHQGGATAARDCLFLICKEASHGLHG
jgi:quercetin dioxygenase-like cupin family protein